MFLLLGLLSSLTTQAQIVVSVGEISGSVGETIAIPVTLADVELSTGFNAFQFDATVSNANLFMVGVESVTTLSSSAGWAVLANDGSHANFPGRVGGFSGTSNKITASGILVFLKFRIDGTEGGATVTLEGTRFSLGATVSHSPQIPSTQLVVSNPPVAADDSYTVDEGLLLTVPAGSGVLFNDSDVDNDPLSSTVLSTTSNGVLNLASDGSFTYQHDGSETSSDSFTYTVSDGSNSDTGSVLLTVNLVNDPPVFTTPISNSTINDGDELVIDFDASDAENDNLTFSIVTGPASAAMDPATGVLTWVSSAAGDFDFAVGVSDGPSTTVTPTFVVTVREVDVYQSSLSGNHLPVIVATAASASISVEHAVVDGTLQVSGSYSGLSSPFASAQIGVGSLAEDGIAVLPLVPTFDGGNPLSPGGSFINSIDLNAATYPSGMDKASFEASLLAGDAFIVIRTLDNLSGELRSQLRPASNSAPSTQDVIGTLAITVSGDPAFHMFSLSWPADPVDPEGDESKLVLEVASDQAFENLVEIEDVTNNLLTGAVFSVDRIAMIYDAVTGGAPGSINLGGTAAVFYRLVSTDGNASAVGATLEMAVTRGLVTDTELSDALPGQFVLRGNYPNPFNPTTTIQFDLPETADVQVDVLDLLGRTMLSLPVQSISAGVSRSLSLDASALSSGIYMYRVIARTASQTHVSTGTMTLIK